MLLFHSEMRLVLSIVICLVALPSVPGQQPRMFDEWGKISINDENARLDNLAVFLQKDQPTWVVYLMFYDSTRVCAGELNARATRAKKWLVTRGIEKDRIIWKNAGYRENFTVEIWTWGPDVGEPSTYSTVSPTDVHVVNCYRAHRTRGTKHRI